MMFLGSETQAKSFGNIWEESQLGLPEYPVGLHSVSPMATQHCIRNILGFCERCFKIITSVPSRVVFTPSFSERSEITRPVVAKSKLCVQSFLYKRNL